MVVAAVAALGITVAPCAASRPSTYINELPHPRMVIHSHPTGNQFTLHEMQTALDYGVQAVELDVHYRDSDKQVVCNHNRSTEESPTLEAAIKLLLSRKADSQTVNHDGLQFFLVLEPKENSARLFDAIADVLGRYEKYLSTAVGPADGPRGITVVITGSYPGQFYSHFRPEAINRLCIAERHDYASEITCLSTAGTRINWISIRHSKTAGDDARRVSELHSKFNVRIWDSHKDLPLALTTGADSLNCDVNEIEGFKKLLAAQRL